MIISRTPVRISFFGGGTDYREYYLRKEGAILGTTIDKHVYVSLNRLSDFFEYKIRVGYSRSELVNRVEDIQHPSVRECLRRFGIEGNLDIHIFSDLPAKTGLGSSSAFTVGFLHALYALDGKVISKQRLAEEARYIEQERIPENVGSQDQFHAAYGGLNIIEFGQKGIRVQPVVISGEKRKMLEECMMVFYTGINRYASEVVKEQVDETRLGKKDAYLEKMYAMVYEAKRILSDASPDEMIREFGNLMHESWELKKQLSSKVTNLQIDEAYIRAREAGAYGGKLSGAGGGGFLTVFADPERHDQIQKAMKELMQVQCRFDAEGSTIIYMRP